MSEINVTNCSNCPFRNSDNEYGETCAYPDVNAAQYDVPQHEVEACAWHDIKQAPAKCPLRLFDNIIIKLIIP